MSRPTEDRLDDIRAAIVRVESFRGALRGGSAMALDAVLWNLVVIGEAVRDLPPAFRDGRPDVPWAAIAGLRNVLVHEYFRIDVDLILEVIDNPLEDLRRATDT